MPEIVCSDIQDGPRARVAHLQGAIMEPGDRPLSAGCAALLILRRSLHSGINVRLVFEALVDFGNHGVEAEPAVSPTAADDRPQTLFDVVCERRNGHAAPFKRVRAQCISGKRTLDQVGRSPSFIWRRAARSVSQSTKSDLDESKVIVSHRNRPTRTLSFDELVAALLSPSLEMRQTLS